MAVGLSAAACAVVSAAIVAVDRPVTALALRAPISLAENVAISSAPKAAICVEFSAATWALVRASAWPGLSAVICRVESPLMPDVLNAAIWAVERAAIVSVERPPIAPAPMAAISGYAVTVVDPRRAFATEDRFPGVTLSGAWPDEAMETLAPDLRTAVVTLTHDPKLDDPALSAALRSPAFYIGALGSKKTHAKRVERLLKAGVSDADIARIHAPIGLDIGAQGAPEIAVSIIAEITAVQRGKTGAGS